MVITFNFTLRSKFFTGANRIIFQFGIRPKNIGGGGEGGSSLAQSSEILGGYNPPVPPSLSPIKKLEKR